MYRRPDETPYIPEDTQYRFLNRIGSGGQGDVWLAEDTFTYHHKKVAIKLLRSEVTDNMTLLKQSLAEEARLQASLSPEDNPHPNIVHIISARPFGDEFGIVMEYIEGGSISSVMRGKNQQKTCLPLAEAMSYTLQICEGLAAAHEKGVIHRDIKPHNVLLYRAGSTVKITDWGIAKNIELAGAGSSFVGTYEYMSPEVILCERYGLGDVRRPNVDYRTDIYSLGIMFYEMLLGKHPFPNPRVHGVQQILDGVNEQHMQSLVSAGIPVKIASIVMKSMTVSPGDRYQSAYEFQQALKTWDHMVGRGIDRSEPPPIPPEVATELSKIKGEFENDPTNRAAIEQRYRELLERYPSCAQVYQETAWFYIGSTCEDQALEVLNRGVAAAPYYAPLWLARGRIYSRRNTLQAIEDLRKALDLGVSERDEKQVRATLRRLQAG